MRHIWLQDTRFALRLVLGQAVLLTTLGIVFGLAVAAAGTRLIQGLP
jgi:hypothetical protein